jgi:MOSC domain-containing protein YiiM
MTVALVERPCPEWIVARASGVMRNRTKDRAAAGALAACELLADSWRRRLAEAAAGAE